jgi:hypothetical protein
MFGREIENGRLDATPLEDLSAPAVVLLLEA